MIEIVYQLAQGSEKVIERVHHDANVHYNHMLLPKGEGLPVHESNASVYMTVMKGTLSINLNDEGNHIYPAGSLLVIPKGIKMDVRNESHELLELIVVKAPVPM